jgi:menaquinone-dependent protoporphyrinogen IX oxidase
LTKALIIYGTRYGATADASQIIADTLRQEGFEVKLLTPKEKKIRSINEFDLIIGRQWNSNG